MQMNAKFGELACTKICNEGHMWVLMYVCFKEIVGLKNMVYWSLYVEFNFKRNSGEDFVPVKKAFLIASSLTRS